MTGEIGRWRAFLSAFLLGMSNLRRRPVRTALTCVTLVILTFTIMSFTSVQSLRRHGRLLLQEKPLYHGILLKNADWRSLPAEALSAVSNAFEGNPVVAPRVWMESGDRTRSMHIPVRVGDREFVAEGMIGLSAEEARVSGVDGILLSGRWLNPGASDEILLPERMALTLGLDPAQASGTVSLWGMPFAVVGIFSGERLSNRMDLDGEPLTPVVYPTERTMELTEVEAEALESGDDVRSFQSRYRHTPGELTVIAPYRFLLASGGHLKSVAVRPESGEPISTIARRLVDRFGLLLFGGGPAGTFMYHASDTMGYSGLPNILIPLLISVFIVLNTMIGSVYERKREIASYTSVGLAPSHVAFLFVAEATAFAVLSVVLGYLLAQTTAKLFAETPLWSGITVNYSSLAGVAAMSLVVLVVLVSAIYPSRLAASIAIPDVTRSWKLPEADGNRLELVLPFLMKYSEHRSAAGYIHDYFSEHQDISHGSFSTGDISIGAVCPLLPATFDGVPECLGAPECSRVCLRLHSKVWLSPFDLGIMQQVDVRFCPSREESGYMDITIRLTRRSGETNAWRRINRSFLLELRKQLLVWRSLDEGARADFTRRLESPVAGDRPRNCAVSGGSIPWNP